MSARSYAHVRYPWRAMIDVGAPAPARQYAGIATQALRYGLPATRRPAPLWVLASRVRVPPRPVAAALRRLPARPDPELDGLLTVVRDAWPRLAAAAPRLPAEPPPLALLALERAAARTVFVMGDAPPPLLVLKLPRGDASAIEREASALRAAEGADVAPRALGRLGAASVEEGLPGAPLAVRPLPLEDSAALAWPPALASIAAGLARLAQVTAQDEPFADTLRPAVERALGSHVLAPAARRALDAAWRDVTRLRTSVLRHSDTSAQNCLVEDGRLSGIVDWEMAHAPGAPGFDVLNAACSYLDSGVGLVRWTQERVRETFARSWAAAPFWRDAREAARDAARAAGVPEASLDPLEVVFFGGRVGDRLARPATYPTTAATAAHALEVVCR